MLHIPFLVCNVSGAALLFYNLIISNLSLFIKYFKMLVGNTIFPPFSSKSMFALYLNALHTKVAQLKLVKSFFSANN